MVSTKPKLPMITPMILFNLVIGIIYSFQVFAQAIVIGGTTGTPAESTLMYMVVLYRAAFRYFNMGLAAAMATVLFLAVLVLTLLIFRTARCAALRFFGSLRQRWASTQCRTALR